VELDARISQHQSDRTDTTGRILHFVLGVNLAELENMVRVRYGTQEGAALYLQKFVTLTMELPEQTSEHSPQAGSLLVFSENARNLGIPPAIAKNALIYVRAISQTRSVSIRDTDRYVSNLATLPFTAQSYKKLYGAYQHLSIMLVTLKVFHPELFKLIGTEIEADIRSAFGVLAST
jgi:hypothetical protein